jgi:hypothetical protein
MSFIQQLQEHQGHFSVDDLQDAADYLLENLLSQGKSLRSLVATFKPQDEPASLMCYLYVISIDAATHQGRNAPLEAFTSANDILQTTSQAVLRVIQEQNSTHLPFSQGPNAQAGCKV